MGGCEITQAEDGCALIELANYELRPRLLKPSSLCGQIKSVPPRMEKNEQLRTTVFSHLASIPRGGKRQAFSPDSGRHALCPACHISVPSWGHDAVAGLGFHSTQQVAIGVPITDEETKALQA